MDTKKMKSTIMNKKGNSLLLLDAIINANLQVFAMGRMKLAAHALTMRLMHMGFNVHFVFDVTCPRIGEGDLLIVNCAVTTISLGIMKLAKEAGAKVCAITAYPENEHGKIVIEKIKFLGLTLKIKTKHIILNPNIHQIHILSA